MFNRTKLGTFALVVIALVTASSSPAISSSAISGETADNGFFRFLEYYELVRLELLNDSVAKTSLHGTNMQNELKNLAKNWSAESAGVTAENEDAARALLPSLTAAAAELSTAMNLEAARDAFYTLSKPLVRYRNMMSGDQPSVAYCPMAKRSWLQPGTKLGNPYYGQSMATCGEIVDG